MYGRLVPGRRRTASELADEEDDPLLAFPSELPATKTTGRSERVRGANRGSVPRFQWSYAAIGAFVVVTGLAGFGLMRLRAAQPVEGRTGRLSVETRPAGVEVAIDGESRGRTPIALSLTAGTHSMALRLGRAERRVPLTIAPGAEVAQYFEMTSSEAPIVVGGQISVVTDPAGAHVRIDGAARGVSPVTVTDLSIARHKVTVTGETGSAERTVAVERGSTTSVVFALPSSSGPLAGWVSVTAPFDVQIMERADVIGSGSNSGTAKIMLAAGRHDLVLVNSALEYRETRKLEVAPGKTTAIQINPPTSTLSVNARPWADVSIDGESVGQTPIANLVVKVGTRQVIFRHPELGERRQTVVVTTKGPHRIAVDFTTDATRGAK